MENITLKQIKELLEERELVTLQKVSDLLDQKLDVRFGEFEKKLDEKLDARFGEFEKRIDEKLDTRFGEFEKRIDKKFDVRFGEFEKRIDEKFMNFKKEIIAQVNEMMESKLESFDRMMNLRFDKIDKELARINNKLGSHDKNIIDIQGALISKLH